MHKVLFLAALFLYNFAGAQDSKPNARNSSQSSPSAEVAMVRAQEEEFRQAELKYEMATARQLLADEFVLTGNHGEQMNKEQFVALVGDKADPLEALEYGEMDVRVYGDTAVVRSTVHERAVYGGKPDEYRGRRTAVWVKRNGRWRCVTMHTSAFAESDKQK